MGHPYFLPVRGVEEQQKLAAAAQPPGAGSSGLGLSSAAQPPVNFVGGSSSTLAPS